MAALALPAGEGSGRPTRPSSRRGCSAATASARPCAARSGATSSRWYTSPKVELCSGDIVGVEAPAALGRSAYGRAFRLPSSSPSPRPAARSSRSAAGSCAPRSPRCGAGARRGASPTCSAWRSTSTQQPHAARLRRAPRRRGRGQRRAARGARARGHRIRPDAGHGARRPPPRPPRARGLPHRDRRLRHRVFLARLPQGLAGLGAQDRPCLHSRSTPIPPTSASPAP